MSTEREWVEWVGRGIQALAVLIMVVLILFETTRWIADTRRGLADAYERYRIMLGRSLVVVRTALGWTLTVEVEGQWPWQRGRRPASEGAGR